VGCFVTCDLIAVPINFLIKIALSVEQANSNERYAKITDCFTVIARQNA
jgi:hypothetical protein